jgi:hypothetical protein
LGALGKRDAELGGDGRLSAAEAVVVRNLARRIVAQAALIGAAAGTVAWLL